MNTITSLENMDEVEIEAAFRERALEALEKLALPRFEAGNMEWARSEKEIAKCADIALKAEQKLLNKQSNAADKSVASIRREDLTSAARRKLNKKTKRGGKSQSRSLAKGASSAAKNKKK